MHEWGDEWFQAHGADLYEAIKYIETNLRKHHIGVYGKEKFGCYRDDYLRFWDGGLYEILFGYRGYIGSYVNYPFDWMKNISNAFHRFIYQIVDNGYTSCKKDTLVKEMGKQYSNRTWRGLCFYNAKIGLTKLVREHQAKMYNKVFQKACKKWPDIIDELIVDTAGYYMIKPCKWGNVDGELIHSKYWK